MPFKLDFFRAFDRVFLSNLITGEMWMEWADYVCEKKKSCTTRLEE